jgi:large subunit ribosomal protein L6
MQDKQIYNNLHVELCVVKKKISWLGFLGKIENTFHGKDIIILPNNKLFFLTEVSYKNFKNIFKKNYIGISHGYFIEINFIGLGARFLRLKNFLLLKVGYSHYIKFHISKSILFVGYKRTLIIYGIDLQEVNEIAKQLRAFKKPDIYKGKGIQLDGEVINYKIGKQK